MHVSRRLLLLIILLLALNGMAFAQEDTTSEDATSPLLELLATVPQLAPDDLGLIYYADVAVAERARMGNANMISTAQQFEQISGMGLDRVWLFGYPSSTALPAAQYFLQGIPLYKETMGFELFDIEQSIYFGNPPDQGYALKGSFDQDAIIEAFQSRDYTLEDISGLPLLCGSAGCENGSEMDLENRNPGNMFGGEFGLSEPTALAEGLFFDSRDIDRLSAIVDVYLGNDDSVLDNAAYAASAQALDQSGAVRQAIFVPFNMVPQVGDLVSAVLGTGASDEEIAALEEQLGLNDRDPSDMLPPYEMMALGDVVLQEDGVSHAVVTFAYRNTGFAETSAEVMQARLDSFDELQSLAMRRPFAEIFEDRGAEPLPVTIYTDEETGYEIVLVAWETPLVVGAQESDGFMAMSGMTFRLLVDMLYQRDMIWAAAG